MYIIVFILDQMVQFFIDCIEYTCGIHMWAQLSERSKFKSYRTDQPTDGPTDTPSYRVALFWLSVISFSIYSEAMETRFLFS